MAVLLGNVSGNKRNITITIPVYITTCIVIHNKNNFNLNLRYTAPILELRLIYVKD